MAITCYTGVMGSGKTYEVVSEVVVPAILQGRRVVTNIAGLDQMEVHAFCLEHRGAAPGTLGTIESVANSRLTEPAFFPLDGADSVVKGGDIVVVDEAWRFWGSDSKISQEHLHFFREHRHYTHPETGIACDIVAISQDIGDLNRKLKSVVELSFRAKKAKSVGFNNVYAVEMWEGPNQRRKSIKAQTRRYDKRVYPLYQSYSQGTGAGSESQVDKRQNTLKSVRFMVVMPLMFCLMIGCFWGAFSFFRSGVSASPAEVETSIAAPLLSPATYQPNLPAPISPLREAVPPPSVHSKEWRLAGFVQNGARRSVILINGQGRLRFEPTKDFVFVDGLPVDGRVDGEVVTAWTGSLPGSNQPGLRDLAPSMLAGAAQ